MGNGTRKTGGSSSRFDTPTKSSYLNGSTAGSSTSYFTPLSATNGSSRRQLQGGFLVPGSAQAVSKPTGQPVRNNRRVQGEREEDYTYTTVYDGFNGPKERKKDPVKPVSVKVNGVKPVQAEEKPRVTNGGIKETALTNGKPTPKPNANGLASIVHVTRPTSLVDELKVELVNDVTNDDTKNELDVKKGEPVRNESSKESVGDEEKAMNEMNNELLSPLSPTKVFSREIINAPLEGVFVKSGPKGIPQGMESIVNINGRNFRRTFL